jgi:hypothetical protein
MFNIARWNHAWWVPKYIHQILGYSISRFKERFIKTMLLFISNFATDLYYMELFIKNRSDFMQKKPGGRNLSQRSVPNRTIK